MNLPTENPRMQMGWRYVRFLVAVVLAIAATAKFFSMTKILAGEGLLSDRWLLTLAIGIEAGVAIFLLLSNTFWSWAVTAILFLIFSGASTYAIASGQDCNCISENISPKMMLPFDVAILATLFWFRPAVGYSWNGQLMFRIFGSMGVGVLVAGAAVFFDPAEKSDPLQFLLADMLVEKRWPLDAKQHPDLSVLDDGKWMILVVRRDCEHCRELLERHFTDPHAHRPEERTAVFIAGETSWPFVLDKVAIESYSDTLITWPGEEPFVASPAVFVIEDGRVVNAKDGEDADALLDELMSKVP